MHANDWLFVILLGGILGMVGQGIRVIAGLPKLNSAVNALPDTTDVKFGDVFDMKQLIVSLIIGFLAGLLAAVSLGLKAEDNIDPKVILGLIAAGYTGADFIEGIVKTFLPKIQAQLKAKALANAQARKARKAQTATAA
jgi:hypothetical protein